MKKKKDAYYFSHDSNARNDIKCIKLRRELGMEGYGIFWAIVEILRETDVFTLNLSDIPEIGYSLKVDEKLVEKVIKDYGLFTIKGKTFYSKRLSESMNKMDSIKEKFQQGAAIANRKRWGSPSDRLAISERSPSDSQVIALKEIKKKEKRKDDYPRPSDWDEYTHKQQQSWLEEQRRLDTRVQPGMVF